MKCSKCGKEIKEGNTFCTNCGTPVHKAENNNDIIMEETKEVKGTETVNTINNTENKVKKKLNKLKIIIPIVVIILIVIGIIFVIVFISNNNETNIDNEVVEEQETSKIEIGTNYNCSTYGVTGYINFNSETTYVMNMTYDLSESVTYNGTYEIEENTITLTVTYYNMIDDIEEFEPYTETMEILSDGTLKYTSSNGDTYIFDKNITLSEDTTETTTTEDTTSTDLLEQIYAKYPNLEGTEGIICTDYTDYWLLNENGNKVYFTDLNSFEEALEECNIDVNNIGNSTSTKIDMEQFVKELSYSSMSTVYNENYAGDGYRADYSFYNEDLTLNDFTKTETGNNITYSITTTEREYDDYDFPITLSITITSDNVLKEIKITAQPKEWEAEEIFLCAEEVEAALGYTIYNRNTSESTAIIKEIKEDMVSYNYMEGIYKYQLYTTNKTITKTDTKYNKTVTFTIGTDTLTYAMTF